MQRKSTIALAVMLLVATAWWQLLGAPAKRRQADAAFEAAIVACDTGARSELSHRLLEAEIAFKQLEAVEAFDYSNRLNNQLRVHMCR